MIPPEMLGHVLILLNWKEFVFHGGCSFNLKSMFGAGLIAGGRGRENRHTVFFTPLDPWGTEEEEYSDDVTKPRKVLGQLFLAKVGLAKVGFGQSRPIRMAKVGLAKVGISSTRQVGSTLKTLFIGSILGGHRSKALRLGKRNRMQSSQTARCHLTVSNL